MKINLPARVLLAAALLLLLALTGNHSSQTVPGYAQNPPAGPLHLWRAEGNTLDEATGQIAAWEGTSAYVPSQTDSAFYLDGSGYLSTPNDLGAAAEFTLATWVNFSDIDGSHALLASDEGAGNHPKWVFYYHGFNLRFHVNLANGATYWREVPFNPVPGVWYHVAMTRTDSAAGQWRFYVNGQPTGGALTLAETLPATAADIRLGHAEPGITLRGALDDPVIYTRPLALAEIQSLHAAGFPPPPGGGPAAQQLGGWYFDNGTLAGATGAAAHESGNVPLTDGYNGSGGVQLFSWTGYVGNGYQSAPASLSFKEREANGQWNIRRDQGTVCFWFSPYWWSGGGPGGNIQGPGGANEQSDQIGRLLSMGSGVFGAQHDAWRLWVDTNGASLNFSSRSGLNTTHHLSAPINWMQGDWHHLTFTYGTNGTRLYLDGSLAATGSVLNAMPETPGNFYLGSDGTPGAHSPGQQLLHDLIEYWQDAVTIEAHQESEYHDGYWEGHWVEDIVVEGYWEDVLVPAHWEGGEDEYGEWHDEWNYVEESWVQQWVPEVTYRYWVDDYYIDGEWITFWVEEQYIEGYQVSYYEDHWIGGAYDDGRNESAHGRFDALETFDGPLTDAQVLTNFNNHACNDAPTLNSVIDRTVNSDGVERRLFLTGISPGPLDEAAQVLTFSAVTSDAGIVPAPTVEYTPGAQTARLIYTPALGGYGDAVITVNLQDDGEVANGGQDSVTRTFKIATRHNLPPTLGALGNKTVEENSGSYPVELTGLGGGATEEGWQSLTVTAVSSNPALIPNPVVSYTSPNTSGTMTFTVQPNQTGTAILTVTVRDNGGTIGGGSEITTRTFAVTVEQENNDPPTLNPIAHVSVNGDPALVTVPLTGITPGDEAGQMVTGSVSTSNSLLVQNLAFNYTAGQGTGTITFTPLAGAIGTAMVTVTVQDDGGTADGGVDKLTRTFAVYLNGVNDAPTLQSPGNQTVFANSGWQTIFLEGITTGGGEWQTLTLSVVTDNPALIPNPTFTYDPATALGRLKFAPLGTGTAVVTLTVRDEGGTANGGVDMVVRQFTVFVVAPTSVVVPDGGTYDNRVFITLNRFAAPGWDVSYRFDYEPVGEYHHWNEPLLLTKTATLYYVLWNPSTGQSLGFNKTYVINELDSDGDGLKDIDEWRLGTNLNSTDTDGDGVPDGIEVMLGTNPFTVDTDNDGLSDATEAGPNSLTSPTQADTNGNGTPDNQDPASNPSTPNNPNSPSNPNDTDTHIKVKVELWDPAPAATGPDDPWEVLMNGQPAFNTKDFPSFHGVKTLSLLRGQKYKFTVRWFDHNQQRVSDELRIKFTRADGDTGNSTPWIAVPGNSPINTAINLNYGPCNCPDNPPNTSGVKWTFIVPKISLITPAGDPVNAPIITGEGQNEFTYDDANPGVLTMNIEAQVWPGDAESVDLIKDHVTFSLTAIAGSTLVWNNPGSNPNTGKPKSTISGGKGGYLFAKATFTTLPEDNNEFGRKYAWAYLDDQPADSAEYEVFFRRDEKNHPGTGAGTTPNWFFYWLQTVQLLGSNPVVEYAASGSAYDPNINKFKLSDGDRLSYDAPYGVNNPLQGIDNFAWTVAHESQHYKDWCDYWDVENKGVTKWQAAYGGEGPNDNKDPQTTSRGGSDYLPNNVEDLNLNKTFDQGDRYDWSNGLSNLTGTPLAIRDDAEDYTCKRHTTVKGDHSKDWANPGMQHKTLDNYDD